MSTRIPIWAMIGAFTLGISAQAAETVFTSPPTRTHLLELFTSEGCSSCPPAEEWLSKLMENPRLWQDFVPLSFHVDYWDRLGWRDPFASKQWTARQYEYSARWKSSSVYTPGFVLDGREWHNSGAPGVSSETPGVLKLSVGPNDKITASFEPATAGSYEVHVARLGFDLNVNVKAGENSGRKLRHDFVVLGLTKQLLGNGPTQLQLPVASTAPAANSRSAIAAWVTQAGAIDPVQAVGGWLR